MAALMLVALIPRHEPAVGAEFVAPYVTSPPEDVERLLALADVGTGDYLIDLGSGDGRIVITAALRGAMGHGVELDPELVALARRNARSAEVADRVAFRQGDIFEADVSQASVVTLYLMPDVNLKLRPGLLEALAPGSRVLSISFDMGDWEPDRHVEGRVSGGLMMWIVPARLAGRWSISVGRTRFIMDVEQRYQQIDVRLTRDGAALHVLEASLEGRRMALLAGDGRNRYAFSGSVEGDRLGGVVQIHRVDDTRVTTWQGTRYGEGAPSPVPDVSPR